MEKYTILEKKKELKLEGTYALKLVGIEFLPPFEGRNYKTFKMRGIYADKNTPLIIIPKRAIDSPYNIKFVKNPEVGEMTVEREKDWGINKITRHTYPYLFIPKPVSEPKAVDGLILILYGKYKLTTYTWGETVIKLPRELKPVFEKEIVSSSGTGRHKEYWTIKVYKGIGDIPVEARYFHGKKVPEEYWDFISS